ncbi:hypothetical protein H4S07_001887, partial [Coemansia furcata]
MATAVAPRTRATPGLARLGVADATAGPTKTRTGRMAATRVATTRAALPGRLLPVVTTAGTATVDADHLWALGPALLREAREVTATAGPPRTLTAALERIPTAD